MFAADVHDQLRSQPPTSARSSDICLEQIPRFVRPLLMIQRGVNPLNTVAIRSIMSVKFLRTTVPYNRCFPTQGQQVEVKITGSANFWVMGIIISVLEICRRVSDCSMPETIAQLTSNSTPVRLTRSRIPLRMVTAGKASSTPHVSESPLVSRTSIRLSSCVHRTVQAHHVNIT